MTTTSHSSSGQFTVQSIEVDRSRQVSTLYRRHRDDVYRIALRYAGGDQAWAEDVTQDVFVQLCRSLTRLESLEDLGGWFYRVTHNRCLSRLRRNAVANAPAVRWLLRRRASAEVDIEALASHRQHLRKVMAVVDKLPPKQRVAFCMYYLDGREQTEIGEALGFSKSYVCRLIKKAEQRLEATGWESSHGK